MTVRHLALMCSLSLFSPFGDSAQSSADDSAAAETQKLKGEWMSVAGVHCGEELGKEQLAKIKFNSGIGGYGIDLTPVIPAGDWPKSYFLQLDPKSKQVYFVRNVGIKGILYRGSYDLKEDTLRISFALTPWERSSTTPSFTLIPPTMSTVITFQRVKK